MHRHAVRLAQALLLFAMLASPLLSAQDAASPATTLSPADAQRAADVLQDAHKRAEAIRTLQAIAAGAPAPASSAAAHPTAARVAVPPPATTAATSAAIPLQQDGLIARMLRHIGQWEDGLGGQLAQLRHVVGELPAVARQTTNNLARGDQRELVGHLLLVLVIAFGVGLAAEWGMLRLLARPRRGLTEHADQADQPAPAAEAPNHTNHWRTLRHLPFALATLLLDLLPVAVFFLFAGLLLRWMTDDPQVADITSGFVDGYVTARIGMCVLRLLVSPVGHGLRLIRVGERTARSVLVWSRSILIVGTAGFALANALQELGASDEQRLALIKAVSLVIHVLFVVLLFKVRRPVAAAIAGPPDAVGTLATVRHWLAQVWAVVAAVIVLGAWFVWALGVEDGFPKLLHFVGVTAAVLVVARIVAVLVLGGVSRLFQPAGQNDSDSAAERAAGRMRAQRYYPLVRAVVTAILTVCSIIALLQAWGVDALDWFSGGTIGRSLASALITILIAATIAVLVWEAANASVDRRLSRWKDAGDFVRAARLRTLLPMLRTCLLIAIVLIVGLTVLNQIGVNTTPLLAGASIIGVALGFGSQKLVQDFITGIFLLMENAMQVGDTVTVGDVSGTVEYLSIRTVRLRGGDGSLYIVPFSSVTTVNNSNRGLGNAAMRVSVVYETDVTRAIDELKAIGASLRADPAFAPQILADMEVWGVDAVDGGMFTLAGQISCTDKGRWGVQRELNRRILERFRELGIVLSNPRTSLLLEEKPVTP
jgi:small-conductance mechanosensitive channel